MRKVILGLAISLDGYIEGLNGEFDWCFTDQEYGLADFYNRIDALFIGRKSYEIKQQFEEGSGESIPGMPAMTEYVFSRTLSAVKMGAVLISDDGIAKAREIKAKPGKDIWLYGGAVLTEQMLEAGLIDELWLSVHPILLGSGKQLFKKQEQRVNLKLLESKTYDTGLGSLRYRILN